MANRARNRRPSKRIFGASVSALTARLEPSSAAIHANATCRSGRTSKASPLSLTANGGSSEQTHGTGIQIPLGSRCPPARGGYSLRKPLVLHRQRLNRRIPHH